MADLVALLDELARGQERMAHQIDGLTQNVDLFVAGLAVVGQDIKAQRLEIREQRDEIREVRDEIREQRGEIREHRKEAGEVRLLIGRVLERLDRLVDDEIADLRKRIERLERH